MHINKRIMQIAAQIRLTTLNVNLDPCAFCVVGDYISIRILLYVFSNKTEKNVPMVTFP